MIQFLNENTSDHRNKQRFPFQCELRYRLLEDRNTQSGVGLAVNASSGGIAFTCDRPLPVAASIEVSVNWPVTLPDACPLRLVTKGRVVCSQGSSAACMIEKFEFRTQARSSVSSINGPLSGLTATRPQGAGCMP